MVSPKLFISLKKKGGSFDPPFRHQVIIFLFHQCHQFRGFDSLYCKGVKVYTGW